MFWFRSTVLETLYHTSRCLTAALFTYAAFSFITLGLTLVPGVGNYHILAALIETNKVIQAPLAGFLSANIPTTFAAWDAAPTIILAAVLVVLVGLILYQDRLLWQAADLQHDWRKHREAKAQAKAEREEKKRKAVEAKIQLQKEIEYRKKVEAARKQREKEEAAAKVQAEKDALAKSQAEKVLQEQQAKEAAEKARVEAETLAKAEADAVKRVQEQPVPRKDGKGPSREELLEILAQTKKTLDQHKKNLSFLAIDVVNSTGMKIGEESAIAERDFRQYKKLVEKAIKDNSGLKASWTPDGVMICFGSVQNAVQAAQQVIKDLQHFNKHIKAMKTDFKVRCGINAGQVMFDDSVPMEEMSDRTIDIAGHMQKYAAADTIFIGAQAIEGTRAVTGFVPVKKEVDGCKVFQWSLKPQEQAVPAA